MHSINVEPSVSSSVPAGFRPRNPPCVGASAEFAAAGAAGRAAVWGDARVAHGLVVPEAVVPGEILIVDDVTPDLLSVLPACAGIVIASTGPWEGMLPGVLHHDFTRSGPAALLRALGIVHVWGVEDVAAIETGDLVCIDPDAATLWAMAVR